ncbi:MAG: ribosome assembly RNA-binding protein YhbY [Lachnospiraceae bacterium]|nr:ribosome assembly RNA-binding protein YhbY [Lachnospiraceae bacterium]
MTSKQRAYLKSLASTLNPIFQVGKSSLTPEFVKGIDEAFNTRELIKIAVLKNCLDDPNEIAQTIAERTRSQVVQVIGKKIVLYKPDKKNPKIILPKEKG